MGPCTRRGGGRRADADRHIRHGHARAHRPAERTAAATPARCSRRCAAWSTAAATTPLRLLLVGGLDAQEERWLADLHVRELVEVNGQRLSVEAVAAQRAADALLLLTSPGHISQATGKLYEYLAARRPIIALADGNEAARIVSESEAGITIPPDDVAPSKRRWSRCSTAPSPRAVRATRPSAPGTATLHPPRRWPGWWRRRSPRTEGGASRASRPGSRSARSAGAR